MTGATSGIGAAVAEAVAERGAHTLVAGRPRRGPRRPSSGRRVWGRLSGGRLLERGDEPPQILAP
ncbi:hypothetical protein [Streptomyces antimycoticus]|uniref:hypothetical protein n=1 Tax=Streptomyces antimycoticus TaxID=68175 RepID=UPI003F4DD5AA